MDMTNKVVLITGASRGIGAAAAREFAAQGAKVALLARSGLWMCLSAMPVCWTRSVTWLMPIPTHGARRLM